MTGADEPAAMTGAGGPAAITDARAQLTVERLTTFDAWRELAGDWDRLLRATPGCTGLQSFDFLATWWTHMAGTRGLWILVFREGPAPVGIAPLQIEPRRILGRTYRVVQFLGMTEDILLPSMLFPETHARTLHAALVDYLAEHRDAWDLIELDELAADDPLSGTLRRLASRCGLIHRERPFHACPYIDFAATGEQRFWRKRSRKLLKNVRASERKLGELGDVVVQRFEAPDDVRAGFERLMRVEQQSWKRPAAVGVSSDPRYPAFFADLLERFAGRHGARVLVLEVGGRPVAATAGIVFDAVYHSLLIVHDEAFSRFSPGTLLEYYELDDLIRAGRVRRYEFLGGALENKLRWTRDTMPTSAVCLMQRDAGTRLLDLYETRAKPMARRVLRRARRWKPTSRARAR